jgi:hypothetical protein
MLVHYPSPVGRGQSLYRNDRSTKDQLKLPSSRDWGRVLKDVISFNRLEARNGFRVSAELGFLAVHTVDGEIRQKDPYRCDLRNRKSSLQFSNKDKHGDIPVVACGVSMAQAATTSAYILRDGEMWRRAGASELDTVERKATGASGCPLLDKDSPYDEERFGCIYERLS